MKQKEKLNNDIHGSTMGKRTVQWSPQKQKLPGDGHVRPKHVVKGRNI
jgi:hypothetical protein